MASPTVVVVEPTAVPTTDAAELNRLRDIFSKFDTDKSGQIPLCQLRTALEHSQRGSNRRAPLGAEEIESLLKKADQDANGFIDFQEFCELTKAHPALISRYRRALTIVADTVTPYGAQQEVHEYISQYSCRPPPFFVPTISLVQVSMFVYYILAVDGTEDWAARCHGCFNTANHTNLTLEMLTPWVFAPPLRHEPWRFLSYQFAHFGLEHIAVNVIGQLVVGVPLELVHKWYRVSTVYLVGVLFGAMFQYALNPTLMFVGCSAGMYALIATHLANVALNWAEMRFRWPTVIVVTLFFLWDFGWKHFRPYYILGQCDNEMSVAGHVGGVITGVLLGVALLRNVNKLRWEAVMVNIGLVVYSALFVASVVAVILVPPYSIGLRKIFTISACLEKEMLV